MFERKNKLSLKFFHSNFNNIQKLLKDNLNVFLKACQQNFQLAQSNLFDTIDLEDLNKRRGNNSNINGSQNNCNSNIIKKDLNDSTDETTSHCNNQSKEIE